MPKQKTAPFLNWTVYESKKPKEEPTVYTGIKKLHNVGEIVQGTLVLLVQNEDTIDIWLLERASCLKQVVLYYRNHEQWVNVENRRWLLPEFSGTS